MFLAREADLMPDFHVLLVLHVFPFPFTSFLFPLFAFCLFPLLTTTASLPTPPLPFFFPFSLFSAPFPLSLFLYVLQLGV